MEEALEGCLAVVDTLGKKGKFIKVLMSGRPAQRAVRCLTQSSLVILVVMTAGSGPWDRLVL